MPRLEFFVVAEEASIDQTTNRLSVFNVVESYTADGGFPLLIFRCCSIALWNRESTDGEQDFRCTLRIEIPGGQLHEINTDFRMPNARHRIINRIQGIPVPQAGELRFDLLLNGAHCASHRVTIEPGTGVQGAAAG